MKFSIKSKLYVSFGIVLMIMTFLSFYAGYMMRQMDSKTTELAHNWMPSISGAYKLNLLTEEFRLQQYYHLVTRDPAKMAQAEQKLQELNVHILKEADAYEAVLSNEEERKLFIDGKTQWGNYVQSSQKVLDLSRQGENEVGADLMVGEVQAIFRTATGALEKLVTFNESNSERSSAESDALYERSIATLLGGSIAAILIALVIIFYICRDINTSIDTLLAASEKMASGDFRIELRPRNQDELGKLTLAYNAMVGNIRKLSQKIQQTSCQVAESTEQLNLGAEQTSLATSQIASSITSVANAANQQVQAVSHTLSVIEDISANVKQASVSLSASANQAVKAVNTAKDGNQSVLEAVNQMASIEKTVNASADVVTKLGERSKEIGQIVDTISGIAGQTNLLALNAAIEAARAGEHGKGFAVVAEEVRKLAEQSQDASKQIATLINEIQLDTNKAVDAMQDGTKEVKLGTAVVANVGQSFGTIVTIAEEVARQSNEVSATIADLDKNIQEVVHFSKSISDSSKSVSSEAQTVSASTEEQSAVIEQMAASTFKLSKLVKGLDETIREIKV